MRTKDVRVGKTYGHAKDDKTPLHEAVRVTVKTLAGEVATVFEVLDDEGHVGPDAEVRCRELRALWCVVAEALEDFEVENAEATANAKAVAAVTKNALKALKEAGFDVNLDADDGRLTFKATA